MPSPRDQGRKEPVPGLGATVVTLLLERRKSISLLELDNGVVLGATETSYGRDIGANWEHIYFTDPDRLDEVGFLSTEVIFRVTDPTTGAVLYQRRDG